MIRYLKFGIFGPSRDPLQVPGWGTMYLDEVGSDDAGAFKSCEQVRGTAYCCVSLVTVIWEYGRGSRTGTEYIYTYGKAQTVKVGVVVESCSRKPIPNQMPRHHSLDTPV
jgi:hypothetical protein